MSKIYISPSNQTGNIGYGEYGSEQKRMFEVSSALKIILERCKITSYISKKGMTFQETVAESNKLNVDIHLPIHSNAFNKTVRGTQTMYVSTQGKILSDLIYTRLSAFTPTVDRGSKRVTNLYELNCTNAVCAYLELMFHDNAQDSLLIINNIEHIAELIAQGVCEYLKIKYVEKPVVAKIDQNVLELQKLLNKFGATDQNNKSLAEDGLIGHKTRVALNKLISKL